MKRSGHKIGGKTNKSSSHKKHGGHDRGHDRRHKHGDEPVQECVPPFGGEAEGWCISDLKKSVFMTFVIFSLHVVVYSLIFGPILYDRLKEKFLKP